MMLKNIKLDERSVKLIEETFSRYELVDFRKIKTYKNPIIHMYPTNDTYQDGKLTGYVDSLFCTIKIFDPENRIYSVLEWKDAINFFSDDVYIRQLKVFKDGSTMVSLRGEYMFSTGTALDVYKVDNTTLEKFK